MSTPTKPMSRRDVWAIVALPIAKAEIAVPDQMQIHPDGAWLTFSVDAGHTYEDAERAAAHFNATEKTGPSANGVSRWYTPISAPLNLSVWWHGAPAPEPEPPSPLAAEVVAAIEPQLTP